MTVRPSGVRASAATGPGRPRSVRRGAAGGRAAGRRDVAGEVVGPAERRGARERRGALRALAEGEVDGAPRAAARAPTRRATRRPPPCGAPPPGRPARPPSTRRGRRCRWPRGAGLPPRARVVHSAAASAARPRSTSETARLLSASAEPVPPRGSRRGYAAAGHLLPRGPQHARRLRQVVRPALGRLRRSSARAGRPPPPASCGWPAGRRGRPRGTTRSTSGAARPRLQMRLPRNISSTQRAKLHRSERRLIACPAACSGET